MIHCGETHATVAPPRGQIHANVTWECAGVSWQPHLHGCLHFACLQSRATDSGSGDSFIALVLAAWGVMQSRAADFGFRAALACLEELYETLVR